MQILIGNTIDELRMKIVLAYLRLYRLDAFLITLLSFIVPAGIVSGQFLTSNILIGLLVCGISVNSVYTLNSWFDRDIDSINKPHRPIPAGIISSQNALHYALLLIALSFIYPFLIEINSLAIIIILFIPVAGILYSNPVVPCKKNMITAVLITSYIMVAPAAAGLSIAGVLEQNIYLVVYLFCYCLAVIPLKDIEDVTGDLAHQSDNWSARLGNRKLIPVSLSLLALLAFAVHFFVGESKVGLALLLFTIDNFIFIALFSLIFRNKLKKLYRSLIIFNILQGAIGLFFYNCIQI